MWKGTSRRFQLERAEDFRGLQRLIGAVACWSERPRWPCSPGARRAPVRRASAGVRCWAAPRPGLGSRCCSWRWAAALGLRHERAVDVGLSTQDWLPWLGDVAKSAAHRRGLRRRRRRDRAGADPALPAQLVGARRRRDGGVRRDHDLALPGGDRPAVQRLRAAAAGADAPRRARAGRQGGRGRGGGLPRGRQPAHHGGERLRRRPREDQAGGALRQPDHGLPARPAAAGGGARARPSEAQRPDPRPDLVRARGARGLLPRPARWPSASRAARASATRAAGPGRWCSRPWPSRSRS